MQYAGRGDLITALFRLHNFLQNEKVAMVRQSEDDKKAERGRTTLHPVKRTLPEGWQTPEHSPSRSGKIPTRAAIRTALKVKK